MEIKRKQEEEARKKREEEERKIQVRDRNRLPQVSSGLI